MSSGPSVRRSASRGVNRARSALRSFRATTIRHLLSRLPLRRRKLLLEDLEGRQLLSVFTVTNTYDSGVGSLRQAIVSSNATTGSSSNSITFDIGTGGNADDPPEIGVAGRLDPGLRFDGTTQAGTRHRPTHCFEWKPSAGASAPGIELTASGCTVKGVAIDNFASEGVEAERGFPATRSRMTTSESHRRTAPPPEKRASGALDHRRVDR